MVFCNFGVWRVDCARGLPRGARHTCASRFPQRAPTSNARMAQLTEALTSIVHLEDRIASISQLTTTTTHDVQQRRVTISTMCHVALFPMVCFRVQALVIRTVGDSPCVCRFCPEQVEQQKQQLDDLEFLRRPLVESCSV